MKISVGKKLGTVTNTKGRVKEWKENPGDDSAACYAAAHYAKRDKENMVVVPGNSYGRFVLHIAKETSDLWRYAPGTSGELSVYLATPSGEVFEAKATRS
jgi:hypothetical protein